MLGQDKFLVCSRDPVVKLFNLLDFSKGSNKASKNILAESEADFEGHTMSVTSLAANSSGTLLASGSRDQTTRLWDVET